MTLERRLSILEASGAKDAAPAAEFSWFDAEACISFAAVPDGMSEYVARQAEALNPHVLYWVVTLFPSENLVVLMEQSRARGGPGILQCLELPSDPDWPKRHEPEGR